MSKYEWTWSTNANTPSYDFSLLPSSMSYLSLYNSVLLRLSYKDLNYIFPPINKDSSPLLFFKYVHLLDTLRNKIEISNNNQIMSSSHPENDSILLRLYSSKINNLTSYFFRKNDIQVNCKLNLIVNSDHNIVGISLDKYTYIIRDRDRDRPKHYKYENRNDSVILMLVKDAIYEFFRCR